MTPRITLGALLVAFALPAAATLPEPKVEYAADSTIETAHGAMEGRVYHAAGKERREMNANGQKMVIIARQDKKVSWMLMPEQKSYMEMALGASPRGDDISGWTFETTVVGPEVVDGVKTTKSKVVAKGPDGDKMGGFWWATADGVMVKMDMLAVSKGSKARFKQELKNLKVGKQDPALFEVPAGYSKMDMGGMMGGLMGRRAAKEQEGAEQATDEKADDQADKKKKAPAMPSLKDLPGLFR